jgi:hypothetical protein
MQTADITTTARRLTTLWAGLVWPSLLALRGVVRPAAGGGYSAGSGSLWAQNKNEQGKKKKKKKKKKKTKKRNRK